jgi:pimeloyl-ACP methyl ester carboxylesterase
VAQVVKGPDGRRLAVEITGAPPGKPVVFLLHGTPGSLSGPRPRGIYLHRLGIRLISYNRPGYPGSERQEGRRVADAATDIETIADQLDIDEFSVIGRSGGAPHALAAAAAENLRGRVKCVAALSSLAPYNAKDLKWFSGMTNSNVHAYTELIRNVPALIATFDEHAQQARDGGQGLFGVLDPELASADKTVVGDVALRKIIAQTHREALRESVDGWVDDVLALSSPWNVDVSRINVPALLWHGEDDVFVPPAHTEWLAQRIPTAAYHVPRETAHFGAVEILPEVLSWVLGQVFPSEPMWNKRAAASSERLRVNDTQQAALLASGAHIRMAGSDLRS